MIVPAGYRLIELPETASTNSDCLNAARNGDPGHLWIVAGRQSEGRGSRGRNWESQPGNLYCSLLLIDPGPANCLSNLTFVAALAVHDAVAEFARSRDVARDISLKWPNDVLIGGKKVAGILLESHTVDGRSVVITGIGVNCASHPAGVRHPATHLAEQEISATPHDLFGALSRHFAALYRIWNRGHGFEAIRLAWLEYASGLGKPVTLRIAKRELSGIFEGIDANGYLDLRSADGERHSISAADVFFGQHHQERE